MKTISMKINPAFKQVQQLPLLPSVPPPRAVSAAMGAAKFTPPSADLRRKMTDLAVCAMNVGKSFNTPTVRLTN